MLIWPRLLVASYATTKATEAYIPLYLINQLQLTPLQASACIAFTYLSRVFFGLWTTLIDRQPTRFRLLIILSSFISSISVATFLYLAKLNINQTGLWILLTLTTLFNGICYQPLDTFVHSIVIKTLGEYRVLFYGSYIRWEKTVMVMTTGIIGLIASFIYDQSLANLLIAVFMSGMTLLVLIAISDSVSVEPADPVQLDINEEQAPLLLKNALHLTTDPLSPFPLYKPYSIFGEQLSHISEEDASQLDRIFTNTDDSLRHVTSYNSVDAPSFYSRTSDPMYYRYNQPMVEEDSLPVSIVSSYALALLPLPTATDPLVAAIQFKSTEELDQELIQDGYYQQNSNNLALAKLYGWKIQTLSLTLFLLGMGYALMNAFLLVYAYSVLEISISMISCLIIAHLVSEMAVAFAVERWFFHRSRLMLITTCIHFTLILCAIAYPCLRSNLAMTPIILLVLQALQASAFQLIWSSGADQVHLLYWNPLDRVEQRARVSFLYSSLGPALGVLIAGVILYSSEESENYTLIYKICVALFSFSFVISWGWTSKEP